MFALLLLPDVVWSVLIRCFGTDDIIWSLVSVAAFARFSVHRSVLSPVITLFVELVGHFDWVQWYVKSLNGTLPKS